MLKCFAYLDLCILDGHFSQFFKPTCDILSIIWATRRDNLTLLYANNKVTDQPVQSDQGFYLFVTSYIISGLQIFFKIGGPK